MSLFLEGIQIGLVLAIMTGPIFFTLLQVGVEEGLAAGLMVGAFMMEAANDENFQLYVGWAGGFILMAFGLATMINKPEKLDFEANTPVRFSSWFSLWTKGFLINTVNPFTVLFWIGIVSSIIAKHNMDWNGMIWFFSGIMGTVALTDFLKVFLAKKIRHYLEVKHVKWLRWISGGALVLFGLALILRVMGVLDI